MHDSLCIIHHDLQMTLFYVSFSVISRHLFCHSLRSARRRMPPKGSGKGRKRSAGGDVQIDPALFLEGTVAGRYKATSMLKEPHGQHLWSVSVCSIRPDNHGDVFATVGSNCASVYRLENDGGMTVLRSFKDGNEHEMFLACAWCEARGGGGALLLAVAGETGVIRVLNVSEEAKTDEKTGSANIVYRDMRGHGGAVNDLKAHPCAPHFLLSASRDESCRLWNVDNGVCVAIFAGAFGHKNEVLSVDIKPNVLFFGKKGNGSDREPSADDQDDRDFVFVSGAMDMCVKVWTTRGYLHLLELSETWPDLKNAPLVRMSGFPKSRHTVCHTRLTLFFYKNRRAWDVRGARFSKKITASKPFWMTTTDKENCHPCRNLSPPRTSKLRCLVRTRCTAVTWIACGGSVIYY